jgi:meso-butanediol dehydrogenase / (S,S)-butanediol dehydrogenase / diacetyl reductase
LVSEPPVAVLTGAASGIGAATAIRLAEQGFRLVLVGRNAPALTELAGTIPHDPEILVADLENVDELADRVAEVLDRHPEVSALVNCAGAVINRRIERVTLADVNRLFAVNTTAPFVLSQALMPALRATRGSIVNVVSVSAMQGVAAQSIYSATKGALASLTRSMATEWGQYGIRVNAVAPGIILTPMSAPYAKDSYAKHVSSNVPLGRWGEPDDLATTIAFLCSDGARYITGQIVTVDGGMSGLYWLSRAPRGEKAAASAASVSAPPASSV